jgi:hypothetical protein
MDIKHPINKKEYLSLGFVVLALVLLGVTTAKLVAYANGSDEAMLSKEALAANQPDSEQMKEFLGQYQKSAEELTNKNIFMPPPAKPQPPKICQAVLGSEAYIDGKYVKVGDTVGAGAKVKSIKATCVILEWEGKEISLSPIEAATASKDEGRPRREGPEGEESKDASKAVTPTVAEVGRSGRGERGPGGRGRGGFGGRRGGMGRFMNMSPEERSEIMERMRNMSSEERRAYRDEMRQRFQNQQNDVDG